MVNRRFLRDFLQWIVTCFLLTLSLSAAGKSLSVETERQIVEMGDVINLTLKADFQSTQGYLNLEKLKDQFEVLGTQRSNNIQIINGDFQSSTHWLVQLLPKQAGELIIPPFEVEGIQSQPYKLTVLPMQNSMQSGESEPFFMEALVSRSDPYVQSQILYTLRFYYRGRYQSGNIRPPAFGNALTHLLKDGDAFSKRIQGHAYTVHEWVYAIYPQSSGELVVDPPLFNGRIRYNGRLKQVNLKARPVTLKVRPEPKSFSKASENSWLPAEEVILNQSWNLPASGQIRVGDTLTQTVTLQVNGLKSNQLPDLKLPPGEHFKVYPDQPVTQEKPYANGVQSTQTLKRAIIPTQTGTLKIPKQTLHWWNTQTDQLERVTLPAKTLAVLPAAQSASGDGKTGAMTARDLKSTSVQQIQTTESTTLWPWVSALLGLLWLMTLGLWWRSRQALKKRGKMAELREQEEARPHKPVSCEADQLCSLPESELYPAIKEWLKNDFGIAHMDQLADPTLKMAIQTLEAALFNGQVFSEKDRETLCHALKRFEKPQNLADSAQKNNALKPLYGEQ